MECFTVQDKKKKYIVIYLRHLRTYKDLTVFVYEFISGDGQASLDGENEKYPLRKAVNRPRPWVCVAQLNPTEWWWATSMVSEHTIEWLTLKYWLKRESFREINSRQMITFISSKVWISELFQIWLVFKSNMLFFYPQARENIGRVHRKEFIPDNGLAL